MPEAKIRITVDVFSGRENPVVEFSGRKLPDIRKRLASDRKSARRELGIPPVPTLGYRGLIVEQIGGRTRDLPATFRIADGMAYGPGFSVPLGDLAFEDFVCGTVPRPFPRDQIKEQLARYRAQLDFWRQWPWKDLFPPKVKPCRCGPLYEPGWWNVPARQPSNNCYNYGCNYRTDTFAQPRGSGRPVRSAGAGKRARGSRAPRPSPATTPVNAAPTPGSSSAVTS